MTSQNEYTVTNEIYSNVPTTGTMEELQRQFDELGWNVLLEEDLLTGELYDANAARVTVAELNS